MALLDTDVLTSSLGKPITLAYGRHVVAGNIILRHEADDGRVVIFLALGEGEWDAIEELYVNGVLVDINGVGTFHFHRGLIGERSKGNSLEPEGTGAVFPFLLNGDQQVDAFTPPGVNGLTFSRTAYLSLNIPFDAYAPGPELDVRGIYRTRRVRIFDAAGVEVDYRYSENPIWQLADLLTRVRGLSDSRLDWQSFTSAAQYCDELIATGTQDSPRFTSNVAFTDETDFDTAVNSLLNTCRGHLIESGGAIRVRVGQARSPLFDFHPDNLVDASFAVFYEDARDTANRIELEFRDIENNFAIMSKLWNHEVQQARTGKIITSKLSLGGMTQHQAERIGNYVLSTTVNNNLHCRFRSISTSLAVMPGDVVRVRHDAAPWSQGTFGEGRFAEFEVLEGLDYADGTREFLCRAYDAAAYSDAAGPAQSLIATNAHRRPQPPPAPPVWGLTANLAGDLKLRFAIPRNADYRTGELVLLADEELARTTTALTADVSENDETLVVSDSAGFSVGDYINIGSEVLLIAGPGVKGVALTSETWTVGRAQCGSFAEPLSSGATIYRLSERVLHFVLPPGYSLAHPTRDLASGKYYQIQFKPGRLRVLQATLQFSGLGGPSEAVSAAYATVGISEPAVSGSLAGLRVATGGKLQLQVTGPLATGTDLIQPTYLPPNVSVGLVYASAEKGPIGQAIEFQILRDGQPVGPVGLIPAVSDDSPSSSGVIFSGAELGGTGGSSLAVDVIQVGSEFPGEDLTINVSL